MSTETEPVQDVVEFPEALARRLRDPHTVALLDRLLQHLDTAAFSLEALDSFLRRGDVIAENVAEGVSELREESGDGISLAEIAEEVPRLARTGRRLADTASRVDFESLAASGVVERLSDPRTLDTLDRLLNHLPLLTVIVEGFDEFVRHGDTIADSVAEGVRELRSSDAPLDLAAFQRLADALPRLIEAGMTLINSGVLEQGLPKVVEAGTEMIDAGMLDHDVVRTLGELGKAAVDSYHEARERPIEPVGGMWGLLRATKDPEIQKVIGLGLAVARSFARRVL